MTAYRKKPDLIILGTSRAINGLRCEHAELSKFNCENLAIAGSTIYESFRYFQHANAINPLKSAIIGIDFFSFNQAQGLSHQLNENILAASEDGEYRYKNYRLELLKLSVSNDTLSHARKTIRNSRRAARKDKEQSDKKPAATFNKWQHQCEGYLRLIWFPEQDPRFQLLDEFSEQSLLSKFRLLVREAHKNNVQTHFVISPSHAWLWESLDAGGLWHTFEDWKTSLVQITESEALSAGKTPFPVWDFSGYNRITTSKAPRQHGKGTGPEWYADPSHYNPVIGNIVINKILGIKPSIHDSRDDFGKIITSKNIKEHLANIRQSQAKYRRTHKTEVAMIRQLAHDAEKYRKKAWEKRTRNNL